MLINRDAVISSTAIAGLADSLAQNSFMPKLLYISSHLLSAYDNTLFHRFDRVFPETGIVKSSSGGQRGNISGDKIVGPFGSDGGGALGFDGCRSGTRNSRLR